MFFVFPFDFVAFEALDDVNHNFRSTEQCLYALCRKKIFGDLN